MKDQGKMCTLAAVGLFVMAAPYINPWNGLFMIRLNENAWRFGIARMILSILIIVTAFVLPLGKQMILLLWYSVVLWFDGILKFIMPMREIVTNKVFPLSELPACMGRVYKRYMSMHSHIFGPGSITENLMIILNFFAYLSETMIFIFVAIKLYQGYLQRYCGENKKLY